MAITPIDTNSFALYAPYDINADSLIIDNTPSVSAGEEATQAVNSIEPTATAVAINAIPEESIQLQELQNEIISTYDDFKEGRISREDFSENLENLGVQNSSESDIPKGNENITDLTSALIESVKGNAQGGGEVELSSYAAIMDLVNKETQSPSVNEQLQAYTQNLRN